MGEDRIPFWTAFRMWRSGARGIGLEITFWTLAVIGLQSCWFTMIQFLTMTWLRHVWRWHKRRRTKKKNESNGKIS